MAYNGANPQQQFPILTPETYNRIFQSGPLAGQHGAIVSAAESRGISPSLLAAIMAQETGRGQSAMLRDYNNPAGLLRREGNRYVPRRYDSIEAGINAAAQTAMNLWNRGGQNLQGMRNLYAPNDRTSDPRNLNRHWIPGVEGFLDQLDPFNSTDPNTIPFPETIDALRAEDWSQPENWSPVSQGGLDEGYEGLESPWNPGAGQPGTTGAIGPDFGRALQQAGRMPGNLTYNPDYQNWGTWGGGGSPSPSAAPQSGSVPGIGPQLEAALRALGMWPPGSGGGGGGGGGITHFPGSGPYGGGTGTVNTPFPWPTPSPSPSPNPIDTYAPGPSGPNNPYPVAPGPYGAPNPFAPGGGGGGGGPLDAIIVTPSDFKTEAPGGPAPQMADPASQALPFKKDSRGGVVPMMFAEGGEVDEPFQMAMMPDWEKSNPRPGRMPVEIAGGGQGAPSAPPPRAYQNAPDSLMGFRRNGPSKSFEESKYRYVQDVEVTFPDTGDVFVDAIKGLNPAHALERAHRTWRGATIRPLPKGKNTGGGVANALRYANGFAMGGAPVMVRPYVRRTGPKGGGGGMGGMGQGLINSSVPGRTDKIPMNVKGGSYVLPADTVSGVGENNTLAGGKKLDKMFGQGPYQSGPPMNRKAPSFMPQKSSRMIRQRFADGGNSKTPIIVAGGEYLIHADTVARIGGGDPERGFAILDAFVKEVRNHHRKTLKKLPGPKQ